MKVLIVDDNEMTRTLLRTILVSDGYVVAGESKSSKAGLEDALEKQPDVIFLDIILPDGSGVDILKKLANELPKAIVLMVTGKRDIDTVKECLEHGAKGFIIKPFNATTVLKTLKDAIARAAQPAQ